MMTGSPRSMMSCTWCALILLLFISACSPTSFREAGGPLLADCLAGVAEPPPVDGLVVEPDDGVGPILDEIDAAQCTVDVSVYLLSDDAIVAALIAAVGRGVEVRLMLEQYPFGGGGGQDEMRQYLEDEGVAVKWSATDIRFSHAKYLVIDRQVALILNQNLTTSAFESNREFGIVTTDDATVDQAQDIFDRDWEHAPIDDPDGPLIVSPTNSRDRLLALIDGARLSIDFYAEVIRDPEIVDALGDAEVRGVAVRLIVDESIDEDTQDILIQLYDAGVEIRLSDTLYIHAKLMLIDGGLAVIGSQNFTATSLDQNRELAMAVTDPVVLARCQAIFERDWQRAIPGAPS
jgi:phosphatidylserine/phosphatidylglycerophosphate/cardiolipin synthase-like enzyme